MKIKCILLGDKAVGKTCFLNNLRDKNLNCYIPTIGVDYHGYNQFQIWDTAGSPRFLPIVRTFVRGSDLCLIMYKDKRSFQKVPMYIDIVNSLCDKDYRIVLISFSSDVSLEVDGQYLANVNKIPFFPCNVYSKQSCVELMGELIRYCNMEREINKWNIDKKIYTVDIKEKSCRNCWWNLW